MSAECTGWVYRHSPARGAAFSVHLAVADSANDQHRYELWMRQGWLAAKARVSRRSAGEALAWLVEHGLLELLEHGKAAGSANRYRFLMPDVPAAWTPEGAQPLHTPVRSQVAPGAQPGGTGVRSQVAHNPSATQPQPNVDTSRAEPLQLQPTDDNLAAPWSAEGMVAFDRFWSAYPRKTAKGAARKAWPQALRSAGGPEPIIAGAERYRDDPNRVAEFTAHPATWLRAERWTDEPLPPRSQQRGHQRPQPKLDTDRDAEAGRLYL